MFHIGEKVRILSKEKMGPLSGRNGKVATIEEIRSRHQDVLISFPDGSRAYVLPYEIESI